MVDLSQFSGQFSPGVIAAVQEYFNSHPDQEAFFLDSAKGDLGVWLDSLKGWWAENADKAVAAGMLEQSAPQLKILDQLGLRLDPAVADPALVEQITGGAVPASGVPATGVNSSPVPVTTDVNGSVPLEQALLNRVLPSLVGQIDADTQRGTIADNLATTALAGAQGATDVLNRTQGGHFDGATYFQQNPDVAAAYQQQGGQTGTGKTPDQFAEQHFLQSGQREGRQPVYVQSAQLAQDFNNANQTTAANIAAANQAAQSNLAALQQATTAMQGNLQGNLAAKASALQQQITSLTQNLDQLDATQKKALADQVAAMQGDLEQSIALQRQALTDQIAALGTAATAEAVAKRAALQSEIDGLTAAQEPLNAARLAAADLQATAVNVGLEHTRDQLTADNARAGFVGGSTVQDAALARATIDARQAAAGAMGGARVANATDTRDIGVRGATGQRTIADALAEAQRNIASQGANGNAALTTNLATGRQQIGNFGSAGVAGITNNTATARAGIGAQGANTTFQDQTFGADQQRSLADALATGTLGVQTNLAGQTLAANQQGNAAKATYYDNDYNRTLNAALGISAVPANLVSTLTGLDTYARSGTNNALNTLNWWNTNTGAAPTPGAIATQPGTTGNSLSTLGSGLLSTAGSIGAANDWWKSAPGTATTSTNSPTGYLTPGGNVGVQTNWG